MEPINKIMEQVLKQSRELSQKNSEVILPENEISIYRGILTAPAVVKNIAKIKDAFPSLPEGFYQVFSERIKQNEFTDERLRDAVNYVIDDCIYPTPTIAQFISFDKRIKVLTYEDMLKKTNEFGGDINAGKIFQNQYRPIKFPEREKAVWVHVDDIKKYNLK